MSVAERIQLMEDIWGTIAAEPESLALTEAQTEELDRRVEAYYRDPDAGVTREELNKTKAWSNL